MNKINLDKEADDFDKINIERAENAQSILIDDERVESYFYKNPWRYKYSRLYAFGSIVEEFNNSLNGKKDLEILEIGCGNGWFSINSNLNNANSWTCFDLSPEAIKIANKYKLDNRIIRNQYFVQNIDKYVTDKKFDVICCVNSLHHFTNLEGFSKTVISLLKPDGFLYIYDVCSDRFDEKNAALVMLIRTILVETKNVSYFENFDSEDINSDFEKILFEWQEETDDLKQSEHDHAHGTDEILNCLRENFKTISYVEHGGILMRLLGGLRGNLDDMEKLSKKLISIEQYFLKKTLIKPYTYSYIGKV